jgi:protein-S-isoprenylcysteine O-methyltransferase Ste14
MLTEASSSNTRGDTMTQAILSSKARSQLALRAGLAPVLTFALLFGFAGRWNYWQGWIYTALTAAVLILMATVLTPNRDLIEERLNPKQGVKGWDKIYYALSTPLYLIGLALGGLDARFGWTIGIPLAVYCAGVFIYLLGQAVLLWARYTNNFFSSMVRIQVDRGHTVCRTGPYRFVRHPGYVGGILFTATMGLVLGSWWACIPQALACLLIIWRTALEDRTLRAELPGYAEYATETKYRLLRAVW